MRDLKQFAFGLWLLLVGAVLPAGAADVVIEELEQISHKVVYVNAFGSWHSGPDQGYYRVILLDAEAEFPHSKIFLQWIRSGEEQAGEDQVVASAPVIEINNAGVYKLSVPRINREQDGNAIELTAINQYSQTVQNLEIWPGEAGRYTLRYLSDPYPSSVDKAVGEIPLSLDYYSRPTF